MELARSGSNWTTKHTRIRKFIYKGVKVLRVAMNGCGGST
jgi:hypothetical protein